MKVWAARLLPQNPLTPLVARRIRESFADSPHQSVLRFSLLEFDRICTDHDPASRPLPILITSLIIMACLVPAGTRNNRKQQERNSSSVITIRLSRRGARKQPHYRVVVIEKERARNGRPVEVVGTYNPRTNPATIDLKRDRVEYWVSKGAQMSDRVSRLVSKPAPANAGSAA